MHFLQQKIIFFQPPAMIHNILVLPSGRKRRKRDFYIDIHKSLELPSSHYTQVGQKEL